MGEICWLEASDRRWIDALGRSLAHDIYHLPEYHMIAAARGEGEPRLLVYAEADAFLALPLLLRRVEAPPGAAGALLDATSVYGYPGPLRSSALPDAVAPRFAAAAGEFLAAQRVVSVFSRLNPLLEQEPLLAGLGTIQRHGRTVSIDLALPESEQVARYRSNHRRDLRALAADGYACRIGAGDRDLAAFAGVYAETMRRVDAGAIYAFGMGYLRCLRERLGDRQLLVLCEIEGELAAGGLFLREGPIAQYHLGGTAAAHLPRAPMKAVIELARAHLRAQGAEVLHLGGGLGGREDSLFGFKAGFSDRRHDFCSWRWIVRADDYARLCRRAGIGDSAASDDDPFFPAYRRPEVRPTVPPEPATVP
jgi:hypothetical protein